jgi:hypothetical protein
MRRRRGRGSARQLDLEWTARWHWSGVPADVRDAVREQLRLLLEAAARTRRGEAERRDDE